jgi:hypothetical protein
VGAPLPPGQASLTPANPCRAVPLRPEPRSAEPGTSGLVSALTRDPLRLHLAPLADSMDTAPEAALAGLRRNAAGLPLPEPRTAEVAVAVTDRWRGRGHRELAAAADRRASPGGRYLLPNRAMS